MNTPVVFGINLTREQTRDVCGFIPTFLDLDDPRPAREQFNERYVHGGGWNAQSGFTMEMHNGVLRYPGDPPMQPLAGIKFRDETILIYEYGYVNIVQKDGTFEVCRMD